MITPLIALLFGLLVTMLTGWFFWPNSGLNAKWKRASINTKRVLLEDALKHIYDCEYKSTSASLNSIAGNLNISGDQAARLIARLESMGLIQSTTKQLELTDVGRSYALRVIRVHRVWERYLADETSLGEMEWHNDADYKEHVMTIEEANELAASIGNPVFDPHGDPIPTASGELPEPSGILLNDLEAGQFARIIHLEDEPQTIYAQLIALGMYPGMLIRMNNKSAEKVSFIANGEERVLAPIFANNVTVDIIPEKEDSIEDNLRRLTDLKIGEQAEVVRISAACRGQQRRRLMDFGIVPGTIIMPELRSAGGDPTAYRILGTTIALRKEHARYIFVKQNSVILQ
ncbi:MAG: FeoA domain-containing protein [Saprospiraceae bacterium]|nr:FeoA domain-containing protein [Saprospiraceae bacterium]MCB9323627.1 FeoA domain-containing protein [Lewinellaceae bacterium]